MYERRQKSIISKRLRDPRLFIQALLGPRQVGKTTLARQVTQEFPGHVHWASADEPGLKAQDWIRTQWDIARFSARTQLTILVIDEVQKLPHWSSVVKEMWDADRAADLNLRLLLLGSSPWLLKKGLTESLAGRFEVIPLGHWSFTEMQKAFGWNLEQYIFFGGYPGAARLIDDEERWRAYILDSLIETTVARDVLLMTDVRKPALLRRLFRLGCACSTQIISFQKMQGQLQDAGNTTTLAHYLELLSGAGLLTGLPKYSDREVRRRASSPKLLSLNNALITAQDGLPFTEAKRNSEYWGRLVENAVGAHLYMKATEHRGQLYYWRHRGAEVDYIFKDRTDIHAIEVKTSHDDVRGLRVFAERFSPTSSLIVGPGGVRLEDYLLQ